MIYIFLDDVRNPPNDGLPWTVCRTTEEAYTKIMDTLDDNSPMLVTLDHDLGEAQPTGYDLLCRLELELAANDHMRPDITFNVHSANPVGVANMWRAIGSIERILGQRDGN